MRARLSALFGAGMTMLLTAAGPPGADPDLVYAEKALQEAKIKTDGQSMLEFFQRRTLSAADRQKMKHTVRLLGADAFDVRRKAFRDLLHAGHTALAFIRPAVKDSDPEVARAAERLIQRLESSSEIAMTVAAARVLSARAPDGAVKVLLAYLPSAEDAEIRDAVLEALAAAGRRGGKIDVDLKVALKDPLALRRLAAAFVYGRAGPDGHKVLLPLLKDADARVRFQAASALVQAGDKEAVGPLLALLAEGPDELAWQAEDLLLRIAGEKSPAVSLGSSPQNRARCRDKWAAWWQAHQDKIDLTKIRFQNALRGLTVVCDCDMPSGAVGKVWEFGADGKERWQLTAVRSPVDVQLLPGGRMLVAEGSNAQVTERDRQGKVLWSHRTNGYATTAKRLPNGNILLSGYNGITEVTRDGKEVFSYGGMGGSIYRVQRLRNGHLLFARNTGQVVEIDRTGKQIMAVNIPGGTGVWTHVEALPNRRYLVAQYSANKVIELDRDGKVHWQATVRTPSSASRLPNGNTLVSAMDDRRVVEFDRAGKEVWTRKTAGRPFLVRRY